jgi:hypothetical protein
MKKTKHRSKNAGKKMLGVNLWPATRAKLNAIASAANRSASGHVCALIDAEIARHEAAKGGAE